MVLGDRELTVTLARVWHALGLWEKLKLTGTLLWTGLRCGVVARLGRGSGGSGGSAVRLGRWLRGGPPCVCGPPLPPNLPCSARPCPLSCSMLDSDEMRAEIEKMKESDVLTEAIKEFGKVGGWDAPALAVAVALWLEVTAVPRANQPAAAPPPRLLRPASHRNRSSRRSSARC